MWKQANNPKNSNLTFRIIGRIPEPRIQDRTVGYMLLGGWHRWLHNHKHGSLFTTTGERQHL